MNQEPFSDAMIVESWRKNASPWTAAVRRGEIESRKLVTDNAIVDAVLSRAPGSVIDLGCGEGWLSRALAEQDVHVLGVDAVPELIAEAQQLGCGEFRVASYEEIIAGRIEERADVVVCNFSLLGKESVEGLFRAVPSLLNPSGAFIVQTLHPRAACGNRAYRDGWRPGSWHGFGDAFTDPAPWYFRTRESWGALFTANGFRLSQIQEPTHPETDRPVSILFVAELAYR